MIHVALKMSDKTGKCTIVASSGEVRRNLAATS